MIGAHGSSGINFGTKSRSFGPATARSFQALSPLILGERGVEVMPRPWDFASMMPSGSISGFFGYTVSAK